jgi:hypothetical protein
MARGLTAQEGKASSVYEFVCLAVLLGTEKFSRYIEHQEFILETDKLALSWLLSYPRQLGKIGRWGVKISALKFEVRHIRGTQNIVADTLSRMLRLLRSRKPRYHVVSSSQSFACVSGFETVTASGSSVGRH